MAVTSQMGTGQCSIGPTLNKTTGLTSSLFISPNIQLPFQTHTDILKSQDLKYVLLKDERLNVPL